MAKVYLDTIQRPLNSKTQNDQELQKLEASAAWYAEVYADDPDLQELTELALETWPE